MRFLDISNLSAGGVAIESSAVVAPRWRELALRTASALGLRFAGVDLACADITLSDGAYAVLEVNATPGLHHYATVGAEQDRLVRDLYARVLNAPPRL